MSPLITPDELSAILARRELRIFDVRWYLADSAAGRTEYGDAHIPGAVFVDLETDLCGSEGPGRHPLPTPRAFTETLRRLGLDKDHHVVVYDASAGATAARMWWMLRSVGHTRTQLLDGGLVAWRAGGHPTTTAIPAVKRGHFPSATDWTGVVDAPSVASWHGPVIDARAADRYRGEHEPIDPVAGHIPGAINLPFVENLRDDSQRIDPDAVARRFQGMDGAVVYCGSGVTACHNLLAMELAGVEGGVLYEGSWSDWSADPGRPVATGPNPG
ncbi:MAG: sulfurtransferase [Acidimicrobiia bacterium]|nr:sulfurtransferase [Acidimicrobiia bacterium]